MSLLDDMNDKEYQEIRSAFEDDVAEYFGSEGYGPSSGGPEDRIRVFGNLMQASADSDWRMRAAGATAFGLRFWSKYSFSSIFDDSYGGTIISVLENALCDQHAKVRAAAAKSLATFTWRVDSDKTLGKLHEMATHKDEPTEVRSSAREALLWVSLLRFYISSYSIREVIYDAKRLGTAPNPNFDSREAANFLLAGIPRLFNTLFDENAFPQPTCCDRDLVSAIVFGWGELELLQEYSTIDTSVSSRDLEALTGVLDRVFRTMLNLFENTEVHFYWKGEFCDFASAVVHFIPEMLKNVKRSVALEDKLLDLAEERYKTSFVEYITD